MLLSAGWYKPLIRLGPERGSLHVEARTGPFVLGQWWTATKCARPFIGHPPREFLIPTRVKADSFRGFQTGASQILWGEQEVRHAARDCTSSGLRRGPALGLSESDPGCGSKSAVAGAGRDL